jgi:hypothetical protein
MLLIPSDKTYPHYIISYIKHACELIASIYLLIFVLEKND